MSTSEYCHGGNKPDPARAMRREGLAEKAGGHVAPDVQPFGGPDPAVLTFEQERDKAFSENVDRLDRMSS